MSGCPSGNVPLLFMVTKTLALSLRAGQQSHSSAGSTMQLDGRPAYIDPLAARSDSDFPSHCDIISRLLCWRSFSALVGLPKSSSLCACFSLILPGNVMFNLRVSNTARLMSIFWLCRSVAPTTFRISKLEISHLGNLHVWPSALGESSRWSNSFKNSIRTNHLHASNICTESWKASKSELGRCMRFAAAMSNAEKGPWKTVAILITRCASAPIISICEIMLPTMPVCTQSAMSTVLRSFKICTRPSDTLILFSSWS
mmetsp:Transcript_19506/g.48800  ORF Transcript_19506/g.48800 Transcript_19506/m.48800 type:complete len:257 (-) Transcript_19506:1949-2719(-)